MAWQERIDLRGKSSKIFQDDADNRKRSYNGFAGTALHYESVSESGVFDNEVDMTPQRVTVGGHDGWRVTQGPWHYFLGQPNGLADGFVGFGGRQGDRWLLSRLLRVGYLHWPTRAWDDIGGAPSYSRANLSRETYTTEINTTGETIPIGNIVEWTDIWNTPGGGALDIRWKANGNRLKEELVINDAARTWIAANRPPSTPASETYFGFVFRLGSAPDVDNIQMDLSYLPRWLKDGVLQDTEGDFDDDDGTENIIVRNASDQYLFTLPISYAYVLDAGGLPILDDNGAMRIKLRKRIYKDGADYFLVVGALASDLNGLPAGDLVFDPTIDEDIAASADDGYVNNKNPGFFYASDNSYRAGYHESQNPDWDYDLWMRWSGISGLSGATIDTSYIQAYEETHAGSPDIQIYFNDVAAPAAPTDYADFTGKTLTSESVQWNSFTGSPNQSPSINAIIQELADSHDPSALQALMYDNAASGDNYASFIAVDWGIGSVARLYIEYTTGVSDLSVEPTDEAVTVGESVTVDPLLLADVSEQDDVTVVDTPTLQLRLDLPAQQDDVTVGDTATLDPVSPTEISETEPVTVGDTPTLEPLALADVSESEAVTVGDTATVDAILLEVSESEAVTVGDTATLDPVAPTDISESEAVTVGDTPTVQIPEEDVWYISEQDDITVVDNATLGPVTPTDIDESEAVTVGETVTIDALLIDVSETEAVTVGDTATLSPVSPTDISESEAVTVTDTPTVFIPAEDVHYISESDGVTVGDTPTLGPVTPTEISEFEAVTVVGLPTVSIFEPILFLSETDAVSVTDVASVGYYIELLGLDKPERKPRYYEKQLLDLPMAEKRPSPLFEMRMEQQARAEAAVEAENIRIQIAADAVTRADAFLAAEKADAERKAIRRRQNLINLEKAKAAKAEKQARRDEIQKKRAKSLKKARRAKKRKAKKK